MKLVLTGAAGRVASLARPIFLEKGIEVVLVDTQPIASCQANEQFQQLDFCSSDLATSDWSDIDGIIHLGGFSDNAPLSDLLRVNIAGYQNILNAAINSGVDKVIYASSMHVLGFYPADHPFSGEEKYAVDSLYGFSKAGAELLSDLYAEKSNLSILSVRIGTVNLKPQDARQLLTWLHPEDFVDLCIQAIFQKFSGHKRMLGVSKNDFGWNDPVADEIGYNPRYSSRRFTGSIEYNNPVGLIGGRFSAGDLPAHKISKSEKS